MRTAPFRAATLKGRRGWGFYTPAQGSLPWARLCWGRGALSCPRGARSVNSGVQRKPSGGGSPTAAVRPAGGKRVRQVLPPTQTRSAVGQARFNHRVPAATRSRGFGPNSQRKQNLSFSCLNSSSDLFLFRYLVFVL